MRFEISRHALDESNRRGIARHILESVLNNPGQIVDSYGEKKAYQSKIVFGSGKIYLVRVIVKEYADHAVVVTAYRTSKIEKYWRTR